MRFFLIITASVTKKDVIMKINIYRKEDGKRFYITFDEVTDSGHGFGSSISLDADDFRTLGEKINTELEELNKTKREKADTV